MPGFAGQVGSIRRVEEDFSKQQVISFQLICLLPEVHSSTAGSIFLLFSFYRPPHFLNSVQRTN